MNNNLTSINSEIISNKDSHCQYEYSTNIVYNKNTYKLNMVVDNNSNKNGNILHIDIGLDNEIDKYKCNLTYERLLRKARMFEAIDCNNVLSIFDTIKTVFNSSSNIFITNKDSLTNHKNNYSLFIDNQNSFLILTIYISFNSKSSFPLELYLYKNDSKQYNYIIENIKKTISNLKLETLTLQKENRLNINDLDALCEENFNLKEEYNNIRMSINNETTKSIEDLKISEAEKIENCENKLKILKKNLILASNNQQKVNINNIAIYLPIIKENERDELLKKWFGFLNENFSLILIYDSVNNGANSKYFHDKVDGRVQTLVFIETREGRRFGGYTKLLWDVNKNSGKNNFDGCFKQNDEDAFIFSLDKKRKFNCNDMDYVIYSNLNNGPCFGKGDIVIADNFTEEESSSNIQNSYGKKDELEVNYLSNTYLAGNIYFIVKRIEVYQVVFK